MPLSPEGQKSIRVLLIVVVGFLIGAVLLLFIVSNGL